MKEKKSLCAGFSLLGCFVFWTALVQTVDVRLIGPGGSAVGFATVNSCFHHFTGVHIGLYIVTDWLGLVPVFCCMVFAAMGFGQLLKRRSLLRVDADILLLGCSYYAFDVDEAVKRFIADNKENIGKIVCFGTSAMMRSMKRPVRKAAEGLGLTVAEEEFHCRGQFGKMHRGRPNADDLEALSAFVQKIIEE